MERDCRENTVGAKIVGGQLENNRYFNWERRRESRTKRKAELKWEWANLKITFP